MNKVLIVEDEHDIRENIAEIFKLSKFKVYEAANGEEGLELAAAEQPDIVVSDILMPKMDGFELLERLKSNPQTEHIPVILLTAKTMMDSKLRGLKIGADDYITKPFNVDELVLRATNLVQTRKKLRRTPIIPEKLKVESKDDLFIKKIYSIMEKNIDKFDFSVEDFVREMGYSRSAVQKKIKAITGKTATNLVRDYRLERAKQLIEQGAGFLSEIASMVGFNSLSYFSNCYKQYFGVNPSEVKKKSKGGEDDHQQASSTLL
ncbi:MAG: response regulator [Bacteroidetes bacterium]|nr:MAG: response regulator [Bacteroidota bacterium]